MKCLSILLTLSIVLLSNYEIRALTPPLDVRKINIDTISSTGTEGGGSFGQLQFRTLGQIAITYFKSTQGSFHFDLDTFVQKVENAELNPTTHEVRLINAIDKSKQGLSVDAKNDISINMITYHEPTWYDRKSNLPLSVPLSAHEFLGLMGLDRNFDITAKMAADMGAEQEFMNIVFNRRTNDGLQTSILGKQTSTTSLIEGPVGQPTEKVLVSSHNMDKLGLEILSSPYYGHYPELNPIFEQLCVDGFDIETLYLKDNDLVAKIHYVGPNNCQKIYRSFVTVGPISVGDLRRNHWHLVSNLDMGYTTLNMTERSTLQIMFRVPKSKNGYSEPSPLPASSQVKCHLSVPQQRRITSKPKFFKPIRFGLMGVTVGSSNQNQAAQYLAKGYDHCEAISSSRHGIVDIGGFEKRVFKCVKYQYKKISQEERTQQRCTKIQSCIERIYNAGSETLQQNFLAYLNRQLDHHKCY